jgi:Holliday junction resolvasome RuvABC endonuclease subunit
MGAFLTIRHLPEDAGTTRLGCGRLATAGRDTATWIVRIDRHQRREIAATFAANCAKFAAMSSGEAKDMQLSQMWREHLKAGCPPEIRGVNIAGTAASALDAEITACVSACVTHSLKMDSRIERRLQDIAHALEGFQEQGNPEVAAYCNRLNKLVSAVLVNAVPAQDSNASVEPAQQPVRPRMRRR